MSVCESIDGQAAEIRGCKIVHHADGQKARDVELAGVSDHGSRRKMSAVVHNECRTTSRTAAKWVEYRPER